MLERLKDLCVKLISVKGVLLILSSVLLIVKIIPDWMWYTFATAVIAIRTVEKAIVGNQGDPDK
jgi:hypothetical protein